MSEVLVLKFGGTSLATRLRVRRAAMRVRHHRRAGRAVVVVVSAAGSTTDRILRWLAEAGPVQDGRERDRALASGEDRSAAVLAATLVGQGVSAISLRGGEAGIEATGEHGRGELCRVHTDRLRALLSGGVVPVVAGFQGIRADGETVTLGRGASDLTAVAIAVAFGGAECHIITDVHGVYAADPKTQPNAQLYEQVTYAELVRLTEGVIGVVHSDAARLALRGRVPLRVYHYRAAPRSPSGTRVTAPAAQMVTRDRPVVRIGLAGCGVVGGEFARTVVERADEITARHGVRLELVSVLVRNRSVPRPVAAAAVTTDVHQFLATRPDVVVEALGGREPAGRIPRATLTRGARFVTANKALIAASGDELAGLADRWGGSLDFEAAVGAGIPVVRALRDALSHSPIRRIRGILNGTCNHVLTAMHRGAAFDEAVREAQRLGFAEADPTRDLDGSDAADKISILAWLAFGMTPSSVVVRRSGLITTADTAVRAALAAGGVLRLIAECARTRDGVDACVQPMLVAADSAIGRTDYEQNLVEIELLRGGTIRLSGPGAGAAPTAGALLGDLLRPAGRMPTAAVPPWATLDMAAPSAPARPGVRQPSPGVLAAVELAT